MASSRGSDPVTTCNCHGGPNCCLLIGRAIPAPVVPHRCPICGGVGTVDHDFYTRVGYSTSTERVTCKACSGRGIVLA